ncbi:MerR family transcriptional regulator [Paracoccus sp. (in: a-proteobacteria)]|uniref:MerR family transcriptional regulator n=1 Tax=Paracoccus sp. TaxID=267 RepID=UPI0032205588
MVKSPDAFRSIGEVSDLIGVAPHVLRYWESQFSQLAPVKRADGRRYYRPDDVRLAAGLCQVMREEGLSIRGAKRLIAADRGAGLRRIGATRLGEAPGENGHAAPAPPRPPSAPPANAGSHWLARLATAAAGLRRHELTGKPLPAQAEKLRTALHRTLRA